MDDLKYCQLTEKKSVKNTKNIYLSFSYIEFLHETRSIVSSSLLPRGLYSPWNSPGQNTGVGSLSLLQGIFPTEGSNPGLPHRRRILYQLSHRRSAVFPPNYRSHQTQQCNRVSGVVRRFRGDMDQEGPCPVSHFPELSP